GEPPGVARRVGASGAARGGPGDSRAGRPDRAGRASGADAPPPLAAATALPVREARDRGAPYDRGRALRRGARRPRRRGHPGAGRNRAGQRRARRMAGSAAQRRAPARGGMARPRGRGGRGGAALEPGARVARAVAAVALPAAHPLDASRRGAGVAGARGIGWREIEVTRAPDGRPDVSLSGIATQRAQELGVTRVLLSLSHTHLAAVAIAVLERA